MYLLNNIIRKIIILVILNLLLMSRVTAGTANCSGGECDFENSFHHKYAKTYCKQTLNYEAVTTDFLYFTIIKTGQKCNVFETKKGN